MWVYIWKGWQEWQPWENTLFYAPLTWDVSTQWSYTVTLNTNVGSSFSTTSAWKTYLQQTNGRILFAWSTVFPQTRTVNYWFYPVDTASKTFWVCVWWTVIGSHTWSTYTWVRSGKSLHDVYWNSEYAIFGNDSSIMNRWNMLTLTWEPSEMKGYLDGVLIGTISTSSTLKDSDYIVIWSNDAYCNQKISEIIMEWVVRTAQEIQDYYNLTKSNYKGEGRQPWANTVAYYPLKSDILDHSGNNNNFTWGTYTFSDNFIDVTAKLTWPVTLPNGGTWPRTISMWTCVSSWDTRAFSYLPATSDGWPSCYISWRDTENGNRPWAWFYYYWWKRNWPTSVSVWEKFLMTWVKEWATMKLYLNAVLVSTTNLKSSGTWNPPWPRAELNPWKYSEIIVEDQARDITMISEYYNLTKSNYWL